MKKYIFILLIFFSYAQQAKPHGQTTHQYIVLQAFELLKLQRPEMAYTNMQNWIGDMGDIGDIPWDEGTITAGAYREDMEDVVYSYCSATNPLVGVVAILTGKAECPVVSCTHFWKPIDPSSGDGGNYSGDDNQTWWKMGINFENAFTKAKAFFYGEHTITVYIGSDPNVVEVWSYNNLADLWTTGVIYCHGYYSFDNAYHSHTPFPHTLSVGERRRFSYEILGRVCHLLGDMGVPAHCHNDDHGIDNDIYEFWMKYFYPSMSAIDALNQGGTLFDVTTKNYPLRYLFYTMNQYSDYYPSGHNVNFPDFDGDIDYYSSYTKNGLTDNYSILSSIFNSLPPSPPTIDWEDQRDHLFPFTIRVTASLLYLFASLVDDIPAANQTTSGTLPDHEVWHGNFQLTGNVTVPQGKALIIHRGANITIPANKKITVQGTLIAEGTTSEPITFDKSGSSKWWGIKFEDSSDDENCFLQYCTIQNASYGAYCYKSSPPIKNCNINHNTIGIYKAYGASQQDIFDKNFGYNSPGGVCFTNASDLNVRF